MRAWRVVRHGEPDVALEEAAVPLPEPGPGEIRIRVAAASLGLPDVFLCRGSYAFDPPLPFTPGQEVAGIVTAAGEGVTLEPGARVMSVTAFYRGYGGFAEEALAPAASAFPVPDGMGDVEAAAFLIPYLTAWVGLVRRGRIEKGETLLVNGGAGGTGSAAIQLGRALGARVIAVAGGSEKAAACRELGADDAVDHQGEDVVEAVRRATGGRGADAVYDPVGGESFARCLGCLANEGRLLAVGFAGGDAPRASVSDAIFKNYSVVGVYVGAYGRDVLEPAHAFLRDLHAKGQIRSVVGREVAFDALPAALSELAERRAIGKVVLRRPASAAP